MRAILREEEAARGRDPGQRPGSVMCLRSSTFFSSAGGSIFFSSASSRIVRPDS